MRNCLGTAIGGWIEGCPGISSLVDRVAGAGDRGGCARRRDDRGVRPRIYAACRNARILSVAGDAAAPRGASAIGSPNACGAVTRCVAQIPAWPARRRRSPAWHGRCPFPLECACVARAGLPGRLAACQGENPALRMHACACACRWREDRASLVGSPPPGGRCFGEGGTWAFSGCGEPPGMLV